MEGILAAVEGIVTLLLVGVLLALLARNRRSIASHRRLVVSVAGVVFALSIPGVVARAWFVDPRTVLEGAGQGVPFPASFLWTGALLGLLAGLGLQVLHGIWSGLQAGAAAGEWARAAPGRSLFRFEGSRRWHRLGASLLLGAALGAVSAPVFQLQGVKAGPDLEQIAATFPGLAAQPMAFQTLLSLAMGCAAAVTKEVTFRGLLLGFLLATLGRRRWGPAAAGLVTALVWAAMHLGMTDAPLLKAGQITLVGLLLAELTRRWGLGAAVATHLGLNLAGAGTALLLTTLSGS